MAKGHKNDTVDTTRIKLDDREYKVYCAECNRAFEASRSDATYCSGKCRTHAARAPQRLANTLAFIDSLSFTMANYARQYKTNARVFIALQRFHAQLGHLLTTFENVNPDKS